jgi:hypothetical protein
VRLEQRDEVVARQRFGHVALASDDALGAPQRVEDGLLGGVDGRGEERIELGVVEGVNAPGSREGEEDLAAAVVGDGPRARQAVGWPPASSSTASCCSPART